MKNQCWWKWFIQMMQWSNGAEPLPLIRVGTFGYERNLKIHNRIEENQGIGTTIWIRLEDGAAQGEMTSG